MRKTTKRCGKWVCPDVCWNEAANQCEECAPNFKEETASAHAQAKAEAMPDWPTMEMSSADAPSMIVSCFAAAAER